MSGGSLIGCRDFAAVLLRKLLVLSDRLPGIRRASQAFTPRSEEQFPRASSPRMLLPPRFKPSVFEANDFGSRVQLLELPARDGGTSGRGRRRHHGDQKLARARQPRHHQPLRPSQSVDEARERDLPAAWTLAFCQGLPVSRIRHVTAGLDASGAYLSWCAELHLLRTATSTVGFAASPRYP
jgi:hypothetical protein